MRRWHGVVVIVALLAGACATRVPLAERQRLEATGGGGLSAGLTPGAGGAAGTPGATGTGPTGTATPGAGATGSGQSATAGGATVGANGDGATTGGVSAGGTALGASAAGAASGSPIVIGSVGTLSGVAGEALADSWSGLTMWQSSVNANGGIDGHPVKVIEVDDQSDPGHYAAAVKQLIQEDHVVAFVGNMAPLTFSAGIPSLEQYGVPALGGDSSEAGWFKSPMAFPINSINIPYGRAVGQWGPSHVTPKKAAVFYINEAAATSLVASSFEVPWKANGGRIVVSQGVSLATPDFTTEVLQAQSAGADVVYLVLDGASCLRFWAAARRQQYHPLWFESGCGRPALASAHDLTYANLYLSVAHRPILPGTPATDELIQAAARFAPGHDLDMAAYTWESGKLFEAAVAAAGGVGTGLTSARVIQGLHALHNETLGGLIPPETWPPGSHPPGICGMVEYLDSAGQIVNETPNAFVC